MEKIISQQSVSSFSSFKFSYGYLSKYLLLDILSYSFYTKTIKNLFKLLNKNTRLLNQNEEELIDKLSIKSTHDEIKISYDLETFRL